jgi:hypothetical protein
VRTICTEVYQFDELDEDAKEKAREWWRNLEYQDPTGQQEIWDSLEALLKLACLDRWDWDRNTHPPLDENVKELDGKRAFAWLENNLFSRLRWHKHKGVREVVDKKTKLTQWRPYTKQELRDKFKYGYRVGAIPDCPLTGMCYDMNFLDDLKDSIKSGMNLNDAFRSLPEKARKMADDEMEWRCKDEQVDESIRVNEYEFTKEGRRV